MNIKPHLFIGSSSEGLPAAQTLKVHLSTWADCDIWKEPGVFELNKGYLENLLDRLNLYEYGIMVATGDDATKSRGETKMAPRDNVVFELGLFMGRLGRDRTFFVFEKDSKLPSDLVGITLPQFPKRQGHAQDRALKLCAEIIKAHVKSRKGIFEGGIFPSVPLAFGYFHNFVEVVCHRLATAKAAKINGKLQPITDFKLSILIPDNLADDMKAKVAAARNIRNWQQVSVEAPETRSYDFFADVTLSASKTAILQDVPTTLLSLHQTITEFLKLSHVGSDEKEKSVEAREIRRFKLVLDHLIKRGSATKGRVSTEIVDI
jgi:hypothetical protein